jgi:5-methylcytosine-specific restriction endonuclease McrA
LSTRRTHRLVPEQKLPRGPNGRRRCRQCGTEVPEGRRTFCGDACVEAWKASHLSPSEARRAVFARDRGVCLLCKRDCHAIEAELRGMEAILDEAWARQYGRRAFGRTLVLYSHECPVIAGPFLRLCEAVGLKKPWRYPQHLWEADHIVPVVEGGGECSLDNYRTLCLPCHRAETAKLAARRAEKRRTAKGAA